MALENGLQSTVESSLFEQRVALYYCRLCASILTHSNVHYDLTLNIRLSRQWREDGFRQAHQYDLIFCRT